MAKLLRKDVLKWIRNSVVLAFGQISTAAHGKRWLLILRTATCQH